MELEVEEESQRDQSPEIEQEEIPSPKCEKVEFDMTNLLLEEEKEPSTTHKLHLKVKELNAGVYISLDITKQAEVQFFEIVG